MHEKLIVCNDVCSIILTNLPPPWGHTLHIIKSYKATVLFRMNYQLLEYSCQECGTLLKETMRELNQDLKDLVEECPRCGSSLKTLKRVWKSSSQTQTQTQKLHNEGNHRRSPAIISQIPSPVSKFQIAYDVFTNRLMFDIEALDTFLNCDDSTLAIIGNNHYTKYNRKLTNILLIRLCVYSLFMHRQSGLLPYVVIVDAGNSLDFYQFIEFIRQYGLDIKETLQRIVVSRAFTVHQLTNLIVNELPDIVRQRNACLVIIPDLLQMFTHDPNIDHKEAKYLITEIVTTIRKMAISSSSRTRCTVSWNYNFHSSSSYIKVLLPKFDKFIEVTSCEGKQLPSRLSLRIYNERSSRHCTNDCILRLNDLYIIPQR